MESIQVKDYMNKRPVTFKASSSLSIALEKMLNSHQTGGPVVDDQNHVVGFLSEQDMIHKLLKVSYHCQDSDSVADCMHHQVEVVRGDESIIRLAEGMQPGKPKFILSSMPMIDSSGLFLDVIFSAPLRHKLMIVFYIRFNRKNRPMDGFYKNSKHLIQFTVYRCRYSHQFYSDLEISEFGYHMFMTFLHL